MRTSGIGSTCTVRVPGTCGELLQGTLDGTPFLVSCPIDVYATITVSLGEEPGAISAPKDRPKAKAALAAALAYLGEEGRRARLTIDSPLPVAKGLGSSTADVGGAILATAGAFGRTLTPLEIGKLAVGVEPSDSTLFPGLALFDHRGATLYESLGPAPELAVLVLDTGGEVDTLAYNRRAHADLLQRLAPQHTEALAMLRAGLTAGDVSLVGQAATASAQAHQVILFKPQLDGILSLAQRAGAVGVCVGHSGTVIGILLDPRHADVPAAVEYVRPRLVGAEMLYVSKLVSGGASQTSSVIRQG